MNSSLSNGRGRLKIFLGYAAGVGKTYRMLEDAQRLKQEGSDIVIGYFEPHGRQETISKTAGLEIIPRRKIRYREIDFEEMDTPAIIRRKPAVCLVDEFAHTNIPGSERTKRWEDVIVLLDAGIDVLTTMNVQHLESLNDQIRQVTGIRVSETVPDWVMKQADEIVVVDATPDALINRLKRGVIYDPEKAQRALDNFFKESTLSALRELTLREAAHEVDLRIEEGGGRMPPLRQESAVRNLASRRNDLQAKERILIHVTANPMSAMLIRRGRRVADHLRADCFAVHICQPPGLSAVAGAEREAVEKHLNFARNLHIETKVLPGDHPARALTEFGRANGITQILLARIQPDFWTRLLRKDVVSKVVHLAHDMRVIVVAERQS